MAIQAACGQSPGGYQLSRVRSAQVADPGRAADLVIVTPGQREGN
jgi:hypothetical protein